MKRSEWLCTLGEVEMTLMMTVACTVAGAAGTAFAIGHFVYDNGRGSNMGRDAHHCNNRDGSL